jgi:cation:H+ antiporter
MFEIILQLIVGLAALLAGGDVLVRGAVGLARHWRVSPLVVGLTVVSLGTSAPELVVSLMAAADGYTDVALGNVVGSNICNIGLVLGLVTAIRPLRVKAQLVLREAPVMLLATGAVMLFLLDRHLGRIEGGILFFGLVAYLLFVFRSGQDMDIPLDRSTRLGLRHHPLVSLGLVAIGILGLYFGGEWLVDSAVTLAAAAGMSQATIAVTVIAVGTSLPELVASLMALRTGQADLAIGNVIGSNLFNLLGILGVTAISFGVDMRLLEWLDIGVMALLTVVLVPLVVTARRLERWEGVLLLLTYLGYVNYRLWW